jgi:hypothetical protein
VRRNLQCAFACAGAQSTADDPPFGVGCCTFLNNSEWTRRGLEADDPAGVLHLVAQKVPELALICTYIQNTVDFIAVKEFLEMKCGRSPLQSPGCHDRQPTGSKKTLEGTCKCLHMRFPTVTPSANVRAISVVSQRLSA